jgi:hypothetical protein
MDHPPCHHGTTQCGHGVLFSASISIAACSTHHCALDLDRRSESTALFLSTVENAKGISRRVRRCPVTLDDPRAGTILPDDDGWSILTDALPIATAPPIRTPWPIERNVYPGAAGLDIYIYIYIAAVTNGFPQWSPLRHCRDKWSHENVWALCVLVSREISSAHWPGQHDLYDYALFAFLYTPSHLLKNALSK